MGLHRTPRGLHQASPTVLRPDGGGTGSEGAPARRQGERDQEDTDRNFDEDRSARNSPSGMASNRSPCDAGIRTCSSERNMPASSTRPATRKRQPQARIAFSASIIRL